MAKTKILVIEDDKSLVNILKQAFDSKEFEIILAVDAKVGLEKVKSAKPDLVILDILLPGESGFEVLDNIKKDEETKDTPVMILSNLGQDREIKTGLSMGAEDYMVKADFTIDEVVEKVKKLLKK
ncbi:response regulator [Patescibacteria group bacterium]|nr:response regulator [Patescibacteria group bacterium]